MPANPTVTQLFHQLDTSNDLHALITAGVQEGLYLEFKQKRDATRGDMVGERRVEVFCGSLGFRKF
jgi:hypothetical protein